MPLTKALWLLPLAWLWLVLINDLRVEWTVNPQYSYGWAVPFLCVFLIWKNAETRKINAETLKPETLKGNSGVSNVFSFSNFQFFSFCLLAFLYAPTRLIEEANPGWRLVSWALAIEVIGMTLCALRFTIYDLRSATFPICFFLVAVPWPSHVEIPLIQGLTRVDTTAAAELLGWIGIPAVPHGNVIEVATGMVGIDEACSGIRSFQATLMISLFLGEFYSLAAPRRVLCVLAGFALSFLFNLARMSLLVWVAARKGVAAIASWHDPAGVTILVACFFSLWGMGVLLKSRRLKAKGQNENTEKLKPEMLKEESRERGEIEAEHRTSKGQKLDFSVSVFQFSAFVLCLWILLTEFSIEAWYRSHESRVPAAAQWTVAWPADNPTFKESPIADRTRQILRYDEGRSASWQEDNLAWQVVFLRWKPGRTAIHLAQNHTPEMCMTAAGYTLNAISPQEWFEVNGLRMPFLAYQVADAPRPLFVFYCLWDDRASAQGFESAILAFGNRLAPVLAGLRNPGQRSLEIAVTGPDNAAEAGAAVRAELEKLITSKH